MDCTDFRRHHLAYVDDTLPGDVLVAAERHRVECATCGAHDTLVRRSLLIARNLPSIECSAGFSARLEARLREARALGPVTAERVTAGSAWSDDGARWDARWYERLVQEAGGWGRQAAAAAVVLAAASAGYVLRGGHEAGAEGAVTNVVAAPPAGIVPAGGDVFGAGGPTFGAASLGMTAVAARGGSDRMRRMIAGAATRDTDDVTPAYIPLAAGVLEASAVLGSASAGIPVWPAALLAGEAPMQLRGVGTGGPSVRLVGLSH